MSVTAQRVSQILEQQDISNKSEAEIENDLNRIQSANWIERKVITNRTGMDGDEAKRTGANAQRLTNESFGGSEHKAIAFLKEVESTPVGKMDFNELIESGAAGKLAALKESDPAAYERIVNTEHADVAALNQAIDGSNNTPSTQIAQADPAASQPTAPTATSEAIEAAPSTPPAQDTVVGQQLDMQQLLASLRELFEKLFAGTALAGVASSASPMFADVLGKLGVDPEGKNPTMFGADGQKLEPAAPAPSPQQGPAIAMNTAPAAPGMSMG